jgi:hypothetical protein
MAFLRGSGILQDIVYSVFRSVSYYLWSSQRGIGTIFRGIDVWCYAVVLPTGTS